MEKLEMLVRAGLVEKKIDELYEVMQEPKYMAAMKTMYTEITDSVVGVIKQEENLDDEEINELYELIDSQITQRFSSPEALKKMVSENAKNTYLSKEEMANMYEGVYAMMEISGVKKESVEKFRAANDQVIAYQEVNWKIIEGIVEIAKKEGLEKAFTDETEYQVTRKIFPTPEDYLNHYIGAFDKVGEYMSNLQKVFEDNELGEMINPIIGGLQKAMSGFVDVMKESQEEILNKKVEKIYGLKD